MCVNITPVDDMRLRQPAHIAQHMYRKTASKETDGIRQRGQRKKVDQIFHNDDVLGTKAIRK